MSRSVRRPPATPYPYFALLLRTAGSPLQARHGGLLVSSNLRRVKKFEAARDEAFLIVRRSST